MSVNTLNPFKKNNANVFFGFFSQKYDMLQIIAVSIIEKVISRGNKEFYQSNY